MRKKAATPRWTLAIIHAIWICALILGLFFYWFAFANRYIVFLYTHLDAAPFDASTSSRYWMSGLVASGFVLIIYAGINWLCGLVASRGQWLYRPPRWWQVWLLCTIPLVLGILLITMRLNWPTLPLGLALACVATALAGLAMALLPGAIAANQPGQLISLCLYGIGVTPTLLLVRAVELPHYGLASASYAYTVAVAAPIAGAAWLLLLIGVQVRPPSPTAIFMAGLTLSYLILPLLHYLFFVPPTYRYITTATNFFAHDLGIQLLSYLAAAALAFGVKGFRRFGHARTKTANRKR